ncbi:MAG: hypothetical protein AB8B53_13760 [Flavobacteriales bacterium]
MGFKLNYSANEGTELQSNSYRIRANRGIIFLLFILGLSASRGLSQNQDFKKIVLKNKMQRTVIRIGDEISLNQDSIIDNWTVEKIGQDSTIVFSQIKSYQYDSLLIDETKEIDYELSLDSLFNEGWKIDSVVQKSKNIAVFFLKKPKEVLYSSLHVKQFKELSLVRDTSGETRNNYRFMYKLIFITSGLMSYLSIKEKSELVYGNLMILGVSSLLLLTDGPENNNKYSVDDSKQYEIKLK